MDDKQITVTAEVNAPVQIVWDCYTLPEHITKWNHASDDWHSPSAENDPRKHGILDTIAPDNTTSTPGSAMAMVERFSLDIERGEVGVVHGKARVFSQVYCEVTTRTVGFTV